MNETMERRAAMEEEETVDLLPLFMALYKRWYLIAIVSVLSAVMFWLGSYMFLTPTYRTSCRVYVNNMLDSSEKTSVTTSDLSASRSLANTYSEIISGRTVLTEAAQKLGLARDYKQLSSSISVSTSDLSEIITITVIDTSPEIAQALARSIIEIAQEHVSDIVDGSSMRVIDAPYYPTSIYSPSYSKNTVIGFLLGAVLSAGGIILLTLLDNRVKDEDSLERRFNIVVLGSIPDIEEAGKASSRGAYGYEQRT